MTRRIRVTPVGKDGIEVTTQPGTKIEVKPVVESGDTLGLADTDPLPPAADANPGTSDLASRADHVHPEQEVGAGTLAELEDVDLVTDPPEHDDVLAWDATAQEWTPATLSATGGGGGGGGGGAVDSVDGRTGDVTLADLYEAAGATAALAGTLGTAATEDSSAFATAAQGTLAGTAVQPGALVAYQLVSGKDAANGYAGLSALGKLSTSVLPALSITETTVVASQAAMLALTAQQGDVAVRSDIKATFILAAADPTVLGNWVQLPTPTDAVLSVNGATGVVVLGYTDVGAASAAQGALADTAVQPGDLGTAAYSAATDFATSAQGGKADTALQPGTLGSAAYENSTAFATASQGGKADSAVQPGSLGSAAYQSSTAFAASSHGHSSGEISGLGDAATKNVGTTTGTVAAGDDARLSDSRTPTSHASSHASAGSDPVTLAQSQVTNLTSDLAAKVPSTRTVNGHALSADVTITASDVGAQPADSDLTTIAGLTATTDSFIQAKSSAWAARTVAQVKTDLGIPSSIPPLGDLNPVWPNTTDGVGVFVLGGGSSAVLVGTVAVALGVTLLRTCTVSAVKIAVNSGGSTGAKARVGIYAAGSNGRPGSLVLDCGTVLIESGGTKTLTLGTPQQLTAGLYFFATSLDTGTSATIYGYASSTSGGQGAGMNRGAMPDNQFRNGAYSFATTGGAMTSTPTWTLGVSSGAICANIGLTIASVP